MTLLFACLLMLAPSFGLAAWTEENCTNKGGQIVTVGGTTFCKSTSSMNWWSAYSWCQAMGGYMPTVKEMCPNVASITRYAICGLTYSDFAQTSTPANNQQVWTFSHNGQRITNTGDKSAYGVVYCLSQ